MGVDIPWGENVLSEEPTSPITGSVSRVSPGQWVMRVFNNSEDRYSVNLEVAQYNIRGAKIKGDSFSYTLKPKETAERPINAESSTDRCELNLKSWKNLSEKK